MIEKNFLEEAIKQTCYSWVQVFGQGDPNTFDVYWHATKVSESLNLHLPIELPRNEIGVEIVELVNEKFISGRLIRECAPHELVERAKRLINSLQERKLLQFGHSESYVVELFIWHGCICMAKNLRKTYIGEKGKEYIRTDKNETEKDNLGSLPEF